MKNLLIITMLLGIGYSLDCEEYNTEYGTNYNCDCNEDTWQEYYPSMRECYLFGANLQGANLISADLEGVNFSEADLSGADLYNSVLTYADLSYSNLSGVNFYWTWLQGVNLEGACLEGAINFTQTNYDGTPILEGCADTWGNDCSFEDTDEDGYDDVSYEIGYENGATSGDLNLDGANNVLDVVTLVNQILGN